MDALTEIMDDFWRSAALRCPDYSVANIQLTPMGDIANCSRADCIGTFDHPGTCRDAAGNFLLDTPRA